MRRLKYGNVPTVVRGLRFASAAEAARYLELLILARAGEIRALEIQPRFPLVVSAVDCGTYVGDFGYQERVRDAHGERWVHVVEDVKSPATRTAVYRLKVKLVLACHGIVVREVMGGRRRAA